MLEKKVQTVNKEVWTAHENVQTVNKEVWTKEKNTCCWMYE